MSDNLHLMIRMKIRAKTIVDDNGCWLWTGTDKGKGYCQMRIAGRFLSVHRASYEAWIGPIPEGMQIDHLCRVRRCCNPAHLEPVTSQENVRRSRAAVPRRTACKNGHQWDDENTRINKYGHRECRTCDRLKHRLAWEAPE